MPADLRPRVLTGPPRSPGRRALAWLVPVLLAAAPAPALAQMALPRSMLARPGADKLDTAYVEAVIRLDIDNGPSAVIPALAYNSVLLLPLKQFFDLVEIRLDQWVLRDSAVAILEPGHTPLRLNPARGTIVRGALPVPYDSMDVVWWDGDLFVATALLDRLLDVRTAVEWSNLSATVGHASGLPVMVRVRREWRHQNLYAPPPSLDVFEIPLRERKLDGVVVTWSASAATAGPTDQTSLDLGIGAGLFGGSAELRPTFFSSGAVSSVQLGASWTRVFGDSSWIRQARVGDVQSAGLRARLIEGVVLTNAPFIRSSQFELDQFAGRVPAGWNVELYDAGRLLAYTDADAMGAFRVPIQLRYGQNPFELVMYGPSGETVRQTRTIRVPFSRLPAGRLEYSVAAGACRYDPCSAMLSADARYGLARNVTLQGGWDTFFQGERGTVFQPYAVVSAAPLPALGLTGEAVVNGHLRAEADYEPTPDLRASTAFTRFSSAGAIYDGSVSEATRSEASIFWRPEKAMGGNVYVQGTALVSSGPILSHSVERVSVSTRWRDVRYTLGVLADALSRPSAADTSSFTIDGSADMFLTGPGRLLRGSNLTGQLAVAPASGLTALRAAVGRRVSPAFRLDVGLGWFKGSGVSLELNLTSARPGPRVGARSQVNSVTGSQALVYANGSVAYNPSSRLMRLGDASDLGRAGITGLLYRDDNGNGRKDPTEPGIAHVPVVVGGWTTETDADGRFAVWGLVPSEPVQVDVDSLSFEDPRYILPASVIRVRPSANSFGTIEIPVAVGGEVGGFVVLRNEPLASVPVLLRELNTGHEITIMTFSDGAFYRAAVPPGEYEVTLPDAVLERLHALAPPLSIFIPPGLSEKRYDDLQLRLEPRP
jgi:hypothetical protein